MGSASINWLASQRRLKVPILQDFGDSLFFGFHLFLVGCFFHANTAMTLFFFSLTEYTCYGFFGSVVTIFPLINNRNKKSLISHLPIDGLTVPEQQPPDSFPLSLYTEHDTIWSRISLWTGWVSCPSILCLPASSVWVGWEAKKSLTWCKPYLATTETSMSYSKYLHPTKHSTVPGTRWINTISAKTRTAVQQLV